MKKILVCGGRRYANYRFVDQILDIVHKSVRISCIVHGCAGKYDIDGIPIYGADILAGDWAIRNNIPVKEYPVTAEEWNRYKKRAGILRNYKMLDHENPDFIVAFPGGSGTKNMVEYSLANGKDVLDAQTLKIIPGTKPSLEDFYDD